MFFIAPYYKGEESYNNMVLHIRFVIANLYFKSIKAMVIMLKIMVTMLILPIKAAPRLIFRRRTATPNK